jgi:hypothetical protein
MATNVFWIAENFLWVPGWDIVLPIRGAVVAVGIKNAEEKEDLVAASRSIQILTLFH